jgi:CBS domain-containing protein
MQVREVLKNKGGGAIQIGPEATVAEAIERLVHFNIGSLPIVERDGRLVGIFTERDVLRGVNRDCDGFSHRVMHEVMTRNPVSCDLDDDVHDVMGKMARHQVGQLPVTHDDELVGLVSVGDLVKLLYQKVEAENQHLVSYLYGPG